MHRKNNKYKLLKSALIQIIDNEKSISGENEEGDMTKDKINKLLEKELFQNIKTIEETQEYIDMFEKVKGLLEEHRNLIVKKQISTFLNFTKEVAKKLEKQSYKKGDAPSKDTYCICDDNHVIEHGCHWLGLGNVFLQADWDYEKSSAKYHFGICVEENDIEMKRKIKKLKTEIKNIFYDFEYHENNNDWIFDYNQNVESDNPKEIKKIAEVMIKLKPKGYILTNEYHYIMPYNMIFRHTDETASKMWKTAKSLCSIEVKEILQGKKHLLKKFPFGRLIAFIFRIEHPAMKINGRLFKVKNICIHCNLCVKKCPVNNIYNDENNNIKFKNKCVMCSSCAFRCPVDAINIGILTGWKVNGPYKFENPPVGLKSKHENYCKKAYERYFERANNKINEFSN